MIEYWVEGFDDVIDEIKPLVYKHASEIDMYQEYFTLDPVFDSYKYLEDVGKLFVVTARDGEELVGYLVFFIENHIHYDGIVYAANDLVYVSPEYRGGSTAPEMFKFAEQHLKDIGVHVITFNMKVDHPFEELAEGLGYDRAEVMYSKYIKEQ